MNERYVQKVLYQGGIDPYRGDNGIRHGRTFITPEHKYDVVSVDESHDPLMCATVLVDNTHTITLEVEAIAGMIIGERSGEPSILDDVLVKQSERRLYEAQQARELNTLR